MVSWLIESPRSVRLAVQERQQIRIHLVLKRRAHAVRCALWVFLTRSKQSDVFVVGWTVVPVEHLLPTGTYLAPIRSNPDPC